MEELGNGAAGTIFRVKLLSRELCQRFSVEDEVMALKIFKPKTGVAAFHQELAIMHKLSMCPYIVQFYAYVEDIPGSDVGILMRLYPYSLDYMIQNNDVFNLKISLWRKFFIEITRGLLSMHLALIAHLDLKPANIMIESTFHGKALYTAVITDFGISKCFDTATINGWVGSNMKGVSIQYADPATLKLYQLGNVSAMNIDRSAAFYRDHYALGVVGWEMLCLQRPWSDMAVNSIVNAVLYENKRLEWNMASKRDDQWKKICEGLWQKENNMELTEVLSVLNPEAIESI